MAGGTRGWCWVLVGVGDHRKGGFGCWVLAAIQATPPSCWVLVAIKCPNSSMLGVGGHRSDG
jgi:hypothetical protein